MKVKYKRYYSILVITILTFFVGMYFVLREKDVQIDSINKIIQEKVDMSEKTKDDGSKLRKLYSINKYEISDFVYYPPKTNMDASEILILKVNEKTDITSLEDKINDRIKKQTDSFKNYDMEQYEILVKYVLEDKNQYIILIVDDNSKEIKAEIDDLF